MTLQQAIDAAIAGDVRGLLAHPDLKPALLSYREHVDRKLKAQNGTRTFFDYVALDYLEKALTPSGEPSMDCLPLIDFVMRHQAGRFVDYFDRKASPGKAISPFVMNMSQGTSECLQWRGRMLFKSAFDLVIYQQLLQEVRPQTIIEIGSGDGGSALWFADHMRSLGIMGHVESIDINPPDAQDALVVFRKGDCNRIWEAFRDAIQEDWPRPWLVIEDAHVNVQSVLTFFDGDLEEGDYLVIEDSDGKQNEIAAFLHGRPRYKVDTRYTDLLGKNATTCFDSILRRV